MKGKLALLTVSLTAVLMLAFAAGTYAAKPKNTPKTGFSLPENARQVSPNVYYLGGVQYEGRLAEGYAFVDNRGNNAKPGTVCGNNICEQSENAKKCPADCGGGDPEPTPEPTPEPSDTSGCYGFLSNGARWKGTPENYLLDASNSGLNGGFVSSNLAGNIGKWESAAGTQILGNEVSGNVDGADTQSMDGKNEVYFDDIRNPGTVGVTIVWGYFRGNPRWRELLEWDQVFDNTDYAWSADCESEDCLAQGNEKMDFEEVSTHELGHSFGLDDLYDTACSTVTMYGYVGYGETHSRSLEDGDINGVSELYN